MVGHRRRLLVAIEALRGAALRTPERAAESGAASAERRQITVLFCDIVGSTPLSTQLDPEEMRDLLSAFQLNVTAAVTATGGYVARVIGDGLLIYFGWPNADEAHAESAVRAGLAIIDTTPAHHLSVRVGIASGLVLIGDLMGAGASKGADGGRRNRASGGPAADARGVQHDRGERCHPCADQPAVRNGGPRAGRPERLQHGSTGLARAPGDRASGRSEALFASAQAPIVGRDEELEFLLRQWRQTIAGDGRVVLLSGEAGIGKSRLLAALEERLAGERHYQPAVFLLAVSSGRRAVSDHFPMGA